MNLVAVEPAPAPPRAEAGARPARFWVPKRVLLTPSAAGFAHGRAMAERAAALGAEVVALKSDRLTDLSGDDPRRAYVTAKSTLAVVVAPPSKRKPQPIPPSADWRFDLAQGCPAHCQYCYLAGSLAGPPITRAYANLDEIFDGLAPLIGQGRVTSLSAERAHEGTTFEASCYTDPLGIEHVTGSLAAAMRFFAHLDAAQLRFTTKFAAVEPLIALDHRGRTRARFSVNAAVVARRFEGGVSPLPERLRALGRMAAAGYPVGLTVAPIMPVPDWRQGYENLLADAAAALASVRAPDLTVELITHRFTPGSKDVLLDWYPGTSLDMDEAKRARKLTKFGSQKWVYPAETMREMRAFFTAALAEHLPFARVLYWT